MLDIVIRNRFKKDLKKAKKQGKDLSQLSTVVGLLSNGSELEDHYRVHKLTGNWSSHSELHLSPDWLLIYQVTDTELILVRSGSHSELF